MSTVTKRNVRSRALKAMLPIAAVLALGAIAPGTADAAAFDHTNPNGGCSNGQVEIEKVTINGLWVSQRWSPGCDTVWGLTNNTGFNTNTHYVQRWTGATTKGDVYYKSIYGVDWTSQLNDAVASNRVCFTVFGTACSGWW